MTLSVTALGLMTPNIMALILMKSNILENFAFSQQKSISTENTLLIGATTLGTMTLGLMTPSITALNLVNFSMLEKFSFSSTTEQRAFTLCAYELTEGSTVACIINL